jgi:hypothetical protein
MLSCGGWSDAKDLRRLGGVIALLIPISKHTLISFNYFSLLNFIRMEVTDFLGLAQDRKSGELL